MRITTLDGNDTALLDALARLTYDSARSHNPAWLPTLQDATDEVKEAQLPGKIACVLMDGHVPVGWGAAFPQGHGVWELHPLLVAPKHQRCGHGRALVAEIELQALAAGARTMILSTADAVRATTIGGIDIFASPLAALASIDVTDAKAGHAYQFWLKVGYSLVGVLPDAEGPGIPSIQCAKMLT
jgi:aminoglycoside 6'-N-acetyltransferase I